MPANLVYEDGSYVAASPVSLPVLSAPFADMGVNADYLLTQDFVQNLADFVPLALDTPHEDYPDFMLASESEKRDLGGGKVQWTRTYAKLPSDFTKPNGNVTYNFIGFLGTGGINTPSTSWRPRFTRTVPCVIARAFFRTNDPNSIAFISAQRYVLSGDANLDVDLLWDNPPFDNETDPTRTEYEAMIAAGTFNLVAETSRVSVWHGNIYMRETIYIKAE